MPNTHNTKNFMAHGGDELVIGGRLTILEGAEVTGLSGAADDLPTPAANVPASDAATVASLKDTVNALLTALKDAGFMEKDTEPDPGGGDDDDGDDDEDEDDDEDDDGGEGGGSGGDAQ